MDLYDRAYTNQVCVDFSAVVIQDMSTRFANYGGIEWRVEDVREMASSSDEDFDVAIDKGTLDAMLWGSLWNPPDEVKDNTTRYIDEVRTRPPWLMVKKMLTAHQGCSCLEAGGSFSLRNVSTTAFHEAVFRKRRCMDSTGSRTSRRDGDVRVFRICHEEACVAAKPEMDTDEKDCQLISE
jgi:hypothetical protein